MSGAAEKALDGKLTLVPPAMAGVTSETGGVVHLQCLSDKHILAKIHPGGILKIKDRRCKIEVVFDLGSLLRNGGPQA